MSRLTRDGTAEPVSRGQILRHERGQGNIHFCCSADHVQDGQPYPVDPYACYMYVMMTIHHNRGKNTFMSHYLSIINSKSSCFGFGFGFGYKC